MPRAHGYIVDSVGTPVVADLYFYRVESHSTLRHSVLVSKEGSPLAPPVYARRAVAEHRPDGTIIRGATVTDPSRRGYFDVPGGLPIGHYFVDVHAGGAQRWAWPLTVKDGDHDPERIRLGGPASAPPVPAHLVLVTFGDSDTSDRGPHGARTTTIARELASSSITAINRAEGNLPVGTSTEPDGGGDKRSGVDVVRRACAEIPVIDVAVCRFGLNDAHYYLTPPTPAGIAKFRDAYGKAIDALHAKGATVVLCTIVLEGGNRDRNADRAINDALRDLARERGCVLVDPGLDAEDDPHDLVWTDGIHLNDRGTRHVAALISAALPVAPPVDPPGPPPIPAPDLARQFTRGTFTASISLYGIIGAPLDRAKRDLDRFRAAGCGNARVWIDWDHQGITGCRALDRDGNFIEPNASRLDAILDYAASIGMSLDLTMHAAGYEFRKVGDEGYDITEHKRALRNLLTRWGKHPALRIVDVANEAEVRGPSPGSGSPGAGHVSPARFAELMAVARSVPHACLVGVSISGGGDHPDDVVANYQSIFRDTKGEILLPHGDRRPGWGARTGTLTDDLERTFPGIAVHHQEPARNGHSSQPGEWSVAEFEASFRTARASGSVGCCLHTDAGFDMRSRDAWDQLDGTERQVVAALKGWL